MAHTRYTDVRGVEFITVSVRITGRAAIEAFEAMSGQVRVSPARLAAQLVNEEVWYCTNPGMRDHVRRTRAERRRLCERALADARRRPGRTRRLG